MGKAPESLEKNNQKEKAAPGLTSCIQAIRIR
jgi:hypothetical protein